MPRNAEALNRLANYIARNPDRYDQEAWGTGEIRKEAVPETVSIRACGSNQCIAGHAARQAGWTPIVIAHQLQTTARLDIDWGWVRPAGSGGKFRTVSAVARRELGLTGRESAILFNAYWRPSPHGVPWALRQLAKGAKIEDVTDPDLLDELAEFWEDNVTPLGTTTSLPEALVVN